MDPGVSFKEAKNLVGLFCSDVDMFCPREVIHNGDPRYFAAGTLSALYYGERT